MPKNIYGKEVSGNRPLVPWGFWAYASWLCGEGLRASEVSKAINSVGQPDIKKALDRLSLKHLGRSLTDLDLDVLSITFMRDHYTKEDYLKWEKENSEKFKEVFTKALKEIQ